MQITTNTKIVAPAAGLFARLFKDGQQLLSFPLVVGDNPVRDFLPFVVPGSEWVFDESVDVLEISRMFPLIRHEEELDTAANPDFRPNLANREARLLEARLTTRFAAIAAEHARELAEARAGAEPLPVIEEEPAVPDAAES